MPAAREGVNMQMEKPYSIWHVCTVLIVLAVSGLAHTVAARAQEAPSAPVPAAVPSPVTDTVAPVAPSEVTLLPEKGQVTPSAPPKEEKPSSELNIKSLFFSQAELKEVKLALNTYIKSSTGRRKEFTLDEEEFLRQLVDVKKDTNLQAPEKTFTYPQFFLVSLVYHSAQDWVVWVNERKFTQDNAQKSEDLQVIDVNQDKVTIEWKPDVMDKVLETWNSLAVKTPGIDVDGNYSVVTFTLRPNQTFSSYVMAVLEGKVMPVTVDNQFAAEGRNIVIPDRIIEKNPDGEETGKEDINKKIESLMDDKEGLGGLIGAYKKVGEGKQ